MVQNYSSSLHYNLENKNYTETSFAHFGKKNCPRSDTINQFHLHTLATTPTAFHRIQRFNTMITWACHWNPSWTQWMGSTSSYITMIKTEMFQSEARERNQLQTLDLDHTRDVKLTYSSHGLAGGYQYFRGPQQLQLQICTQKMVVIHLSEMLVKRKRVQDFTIH